MALDQALCRLSLQCLVLNAPTWNTRHPPESQGQVGEGHGYRCGCERDSVCVCMYAHVCIYMLGCQAHVHEDSRDSMDVCVRPPCVREEHVCGGAEALHDSVCVCRCVRALRGLAEATLRVYVLGKGDSMVATLPPGSGLGPSCRGSPGAVCLDNPGRIPAFPFSQGWAQVRRTRVPVRYQHVTTCHALTSSFPTLWQSQTEPCHSLFGTLGPPASLITSSSPPCTPLTSAMAAWHSQNAVHLLSAASRPQPSLILISPYTSHPTPPAPACWALASRPF